MSVLVDLGESRYWLIDSSRWPQWLNAEWLTDNDAQLLCRLTTADDLTALRALVPDVERLLVIPLYLTLTEHLDTNGLTTLTQTLMTQLAADRYLLIAKDTPAPTAEKHYSPVAPAPQTLTGSDKPRLALVSPMPPAASGIANYCAEVMPALAQYYDITLVVNDPTVLADDVTGHSAVVSHAAFVRGEAQVDRIMYHMGNSHFHYDYLSMIKARPGVVVLHDIYLGDCIFSNFKKYGETQLLQSIYASHGWSALQDCRDSVKTSIALYPACGELLQDSYGVIVHNRFALENLGLFFSDRMLEHTTSIPLARKVRALPDSAAARSELHLPSDAIVFSTFGLINNNKCIQELLEAWMTSGLANVSNAYLLLVGNCSEPKLRRYIVDYIQSLPLPDHVVHTGFIDNDTYDRYLSATDIAIQLRQNSRGESSAALLDCMAAALPTIINEHGSMAEVPPGTAVRIPDDFTLAQLSQALIEAKALIEGKAGTGVLAQDYVAQHHCPERVAEDYKNQLENVYGTSYQYRADRAYLTLFGEKKALLDAAQLWNCTEEFNDFVRCGVSGRRAPQGPQLLIDISAVVQHDLKSGIQRVVRNILKQLLNDRYIGYRVEAVYYDFESECFRYARNFCNRFLGLPALYLNDDPVETQRGDIYLGLDLFYIIAGREASRRPLQHWRGRGVTIYHVIYDLMPLQLPHCFPPDQLPLYSQWLEAITDVSDGLVCISKAVADDYTAWQEDQKDRSLNEPHVGFFHLGAEMESGGEAVSLTQADEERLSAISQKPYLLMVGTIEPRKGHQQVLDAFESLWDKGVDLDLVIVGSTGWVDDAFAQRLASMDANHDKLHCLQFVPEELLRALYRNAAGTLMASQGEGFGLPLIEAAYYGSPLLARDLPVFREVCGKHAWYFDSTTGDALATELVAWFEQYDQGTTPKPDGMTWLDWRQSTQQLLENILNDRWYSHS